MGFWGFALGVLTLCAIYAVLTLVLNLHFGTAGLINLGTAALVAVGAYTSVLFAAPPPGAGDLYLIGLHLPLWVGFLAAGFASAAFAWVIGQAALRLRAEYLAICTFAFAEVTRYLLMNEPRISNGLRGFWGIQRPWQESLSPSASDVMVLCIALALLVATFLLFTRFARTPYGLIARGVKESEDVIRSTGKDVARIRVSVFVYGAFFAGLAGAVYAWYSQIIVPNMFTAEITFFGWSALVIGGTGNPVGAVVGSLLLIIFEEATRFLQVSAKYAAAISSSRYILMGLLTILVLRFRPRGLFPERRTVA